MLRRLLLSLVVVGVRPLLIQRRPLLRPVARVGQGLNLLLLLVWVLLRWLLLQQLQWLLPPPGLPLSLRRHEPLLLLLLRLHLLLLLLLM